MPTINISASLVVYKPDLQTIERTLLALQEAGRFAKAQHPLKLSLILVDNSDDEEVFGRLARWLDGVKPALPDWEFSLLRSPGNVGYGRGNNLVIDNACSDYHLVINPDLFVRVNALCEAVRYMESHRDVGLLTPAVFSENGERQYLCKRNPTLLIMFLRSFAPEWLRSALRSVIEEFEMRDCDYSREIHPVEYPTGCFMFFRTRQLQEIGGFDPKIFLHYEDADIGRRMLAIARVNYVPSVAVVHKWARDTHKSFRSMMITVRSGWYYWLKWGGIFGNAPAKEPAPPQSAIELPRLNAAVGAGRHVLVTGANGFIGRAVCAELPQFGFSILGAIRRLDMAKPSESVRYCEMRDMDEHTNWADALAGIDSVVHLAARVHVMRETSSDPLAEYRRVNVGMTMNLARQAAAAGVRRFVFVSSIKVNGENTPVGQPFTADDPPHPHDPYGVSKLEAEQALLGLARETGMEVVIIRPPLVYGPGVKANFFTMMWWLDKGVPLPFGALNNRRSLVALDNLTSFILTCLHHPRAANQIFLVSDDDDVTFTELLRRIAESMGKRIVLVPIPRFLLKIIAYITFNQQYAYRLLSSLQIDINKNRVLLGWSPPVRASTALRKVALEFRESPSTRH